MKNKKNNIFKRISRFFGKYINGTKGAVSLLLALVVSPLLSTSLILVESARYQDAIQLMEEIMDSSAFSTLAEYDSFLDERFGLLSVSQGQDINSVFGSYLDDNVDALGKSVSINSKSANGAFALSNTDVLKQQLLEFSEISVATEVITEGIDLEDLLSKLSDALNMEDLKKEVEAVSSGVDLASEIEKLIENITKARDQYRDKYKPALDDYKDAYSDFETKALALITAIETAEANLEEDESHDSIYEEKDVKDAIKDLKKSRDDYKSAAETLKSELSTIKGQIESVISAVDEIPSKLQDFDDKTSESTLAGDCTTSTYEWLNIVFDQITTTIDTTVGDNFKQESADEIRALEAQIEKLGNLGDKTITSSWDQSKIKTEYGRVSISAVGNSFDTKMDSLINILNSKADVGDEGKSQMGNLLDIVGELLGVSGLYDSNLNAIVSTSSLYADTNMSLSAKMSMQSLTDLVNACDTFVDGISSFNIIKAVKAIGTLLKAVVEFLTSIIAWVAETLVNLVTFIAGGPTEWYNGMLLYGYGAYNLPNRTNAYGANAKKGIAGYSYEDLYHMAGGSDLDPSITGSLKTMSTIGNTTGTDTMFKGAAAEYIIAGSKSEIQNQSIVFFDLYLLRLILDLPIVLSNPEVSSISAMAGPGAWVVKLAIALAEPMLDTIILVNGGKSFIFKRDAKGSTVYLSWSGMVLLQNDLADITALSSNLKDKIKDTIKANNGTPTEHGMCDASYTEHMLLLMLLSVNQSTYMKRLQNVIQMEAATKNKSEYAFKLDKAYTYIQMDVTYTLNPMFNIDSLTDNGLFTTTSKKYSGY